MTIIKTKNFHHNNLQLQLIYETDLDIYTINIHRFNTQNDFDMFGIFLDLKSATKKFNSITL